MCEIQVDDGCYFDDGLRTVDFVIVLKGASVVPLATYIRNLETMGVEFELTEGQVVKKHFLLVHLPYEPLNHFAVVYNIGMEERKLGFERQFTYSYSTPISYIPPKLKGTFTNGERIMILNKLLENATYGDGINQTGLSKLIRAKLVEDAYPLHDGPIDNDLLEYTNDRQLLFHYWSNLTVWNKEMPLDMIKQYFGCEIAFYFAWLEFFNYMLIPAAIIGTAIAIMNIIVLTSFHVKPVDEVCFVNNMMVCPTSEFGKHSNFDKLSSFCLFVKLKYVFDNYLTIAFAVFMSLWAFFFIKWWKRKENGLKFRWDVQYENPILDTRKDSRKSKFNLLTGEEEPFVPMYVTILSRTVSVCISLLMVSEIMTIVQAAYRHSLQSYGHGSICANFIMYFKDFKSPCTVEVEQNQLAFHDIFLVFSLVIVGIFGVIVYELTITTIMNMSKPYLKRERAKPMALVTGTILQVVFIQVFSLVYRKLCNLLSILGSAKTQLENEHSFLYKRYLISFANNYAIFFYIAFLKGRFFTVPNRPENIPIFERDTCQPLTCILGLSIMLFVYLLLKRFAENIFTLLMPKRWTTKLILKRKDFAKMPQYEEEYGLSTDRFLIINRFCDMVTEYGLVTFFVAALPLAPMCILLNNLLDARVHAYKLVVRYRRPVPKRTGGIGVWNGILLGLTYLSTATNAFVIAFTSDFVAREIYISTMDPYLGGYINSTLSIFNVTDTPQAKDMKSYPDMCYYRAKRYPPDHRKRYQLTKDYWVELMWRLVFVFIFEHVMLLYHGIITYGISDVPQDVRLREKIDKQLAREARQSFKRRAKKYK